MIVEGTDPYSFVGEDFNGQLRTRLVSQSLMPNFEEIRSSTDQFSDISLDCELRVKGLNTTLVASASAAQESTDLFSC